MPTYSTPPKVVSKAIAFGTASLSTGVKVADLAVGDLVTKIWTEIATAWNTQTSATAEVGIADDDLNPEVALATFDLKATATVGADVAAGQAPATGGTGAAGGRAVTSAAIYVKVTEVGTGASAGAATVYALVESADAAGAAYVPGSTTPTQTVGTGQTGGYVA